MNPDKTTGWERHAQSIVAALILALTGYVAKEMTSMGKDVVAVRSEVSVVSTRLDSLEKSIADIDERFDRYQPKREAELSKEAQLLRLQMLHGRIDALESKRHAQQ